VEPLPPDPSAPEPAAASPSRTPDLVPAGPFGELPAAAAIPAGCTFAARFAAAAMGFLDQGSLRTSRGRRGLSCTGLVQACFDVLGCGERPRGSSRDLWAWCEARRLLVDRPVPGDLAFFDDTWDRDGEPGTRDPLTHVAVVVEVGGPGEVRFVHVGSRKVKAGTLDSPVRARRSRDTPGTRYLGRELLRGYCRPRPCGAFTTPD
ncbi:MAG: CHAP domain-containing protein, partial [Deltaproteobacteria bacterium]|nr:CHAP domain-containing protein [Deltaproteobacteria bacterium]